MEIIDDLLASDGWEGMRSIFGDTINLSAGDARDVVNFYSTVLAFAKSREIKLVKKQRVVFLVSFF